MTSSNNEQAVRLLERIVAEGPVHLRDDAFEALRELRPVQYLAPGKADYITKIVQKDICYLEDFEVADCARVLSVIQGNPDKE